MPMNDQPAKKPKLARHLLSSGMPGADHGVFLVATPLIGGIGVLITAFASYSLTGFVWLVALTTLLTAIMAMMEIVQAPAAWSGEPPLKRILGWGAALLLLWPAAYPLYWRERARLKLDTWLKTAIVVDVLFVAAALAGGIVTVTGFDRPPPSVAQAEQEPTLLTTDPHWFPDADDVDIVGGGTCMDVVARQLADEGRWPRGRSEPRLKTVNRHSQSHGQGHLPHPGSAGICNPHPCDTGLRDRSVGGELAASEA